MNHYALRLFVRSLISEAKDKKVEKEPKKAAKKDTKKSEPKKAKKSSGNLVEMKKELADLKDKLAKIDDTIKDWESIKSAANNMSYGGEQDVEIGADKQEEILKDCDATIEKLQKEKESIEKEMASLKENTYSEINKIKEMMGLVAPKKKGAEKMMDEKKEEKVVKKENIHNTAQMGGVTTSKGTTGYINKPDNQKGGDYDPKKRAASLAKLKNFGPKKK